MSAFTDAHAIHHIVPDTSGATEAEANILATRSTEEWKHQVGSWKLPGGGELKPGHEW